MPSAFPQGLKPGFICGTCGTTKVVPLEFLHFSGGSGGGDCLVSGIESEGCE